MKRSWHNAKNAVLVFCGDLFFVSMSLLAASLGVVLGVFGLLFLGPAGMVRNFSIWLTTKISR